jgi:hypothetical protein
MSQAQIQRTELARRTRRKRVLMQSVIADVSGSHLFDCTILDVSDEGARIRLSAKYELPKIYYLINVPARLAYEAVTVWRNSTQVGVRFAKTIPVAATTDPALAFLRRLWLQAAAS